MAPPSSLEAEAGAHLSLGEELPGALVSGVTGGQDPELGVGVGSPGELVGFQGGLHLAAGEKCECHRQLAQGTKMG